MDLITFELIFELLELTKDIIDPNIYIILDRPHTIGG